MDDHDERRGIARRGNPAALQAFVAAVEHLPLFTGTALQLIRSVDQEAITAGELSRLISTDPALAAHLLRIVNSPYYGLSRRIGTVSDALAVLGFNLVRRTVTAAVLERPLFAYFTDTEAARVFWRHELLCAAIARHLAIRQGFDGEFAYMAGLLHDVGRLVMVVRHPAASEGLLRLHGGDDATFQEERARYGFDHAEFGAALLELWGLPGGMIQAAHQHVDDVEPDDPGAAIVWRANRIAHEWIDAGEETGDEEPAWMEAIDLSAAGRQQILDEIAALESDRL